MSTDQMSGNVLDGRYEILARLARGGMATVYRAWDRRLERIVAVKVMHEGLGDDSDFKARFDREARSAAALTCPNVVSIYDQGVEQGRPYIVMEFIEGYTLRNLIAKEAPFSPLKALKLLEPVAAALAAAHDNGLVHRDVKPENVLISERGDVKVADFGLARSVSTQTATATQGMLIGTVSYLPPELVMSGQADSRSDVYSFGIVLFELLTGTKPFIGDSPITVAYAHVNGEVPRPSQRLMEKKPNAARHHPIPDYIDALVLACTRRDPTLRPRDGHALLTRIRRARRALERGIRHDQALTMIMFPGADHRGQQEMTYEPPVTQSEPVAEYSYDEPSEPVQPAPAPVAAPVKVRTQPHKKTTARRRRFSLALLVLLAILVSVGTWWLAAGRYIDTPELIGLDRATASATAQELGLSVEFTEDFSEDVPADHVISTDPAPGERVERQGTIHASISKGKERYPMPDLIGKTVDEARSILSSNNLRLGKVSEVYHDTAAEKTIVSTSFGAGEPLKRDTTVDIEVSKGRKPVEIPNVTSDTLEEATKKLTDLGLLVETTRANDKDVPKDKVISQEPVATTQGFVGDTVKLTVSDGPKEIEMIDVEGMSVDEATKKLEEAGLAVDEVKYPFGTRNRKVLWTDPKVGKKVAEGSKVVITAR